MQMEFIAAVVLIPGSLNFQKTMKVSKSHFSYLKIGSFSQGSQKNFTEPFRYSESWADKVQGIYHQILPVRSSSVGTSSLKVDFFFQKRLRKIQKVDHFPRFKRDAIIIIRFLSSINSCHGFMVIQTFSSI